MRRSRFTAAALGAVAAASVATAIGFGSSHREAPGTSIDPTADDTDVYAFTADDAQDHLTVVANWIPFEDPAGGPNFYRFDDRAAYYINIDNTGDGRADIRYRFRFRTSVGDPESFLYALPGVSSIDDPKLNIKQHYSVTREVLRNGREMSSTVVADDVPVAPNNVGPKTIPDYDAVAEQAIRDLPNDGKVFAGQRDDPFFVDLGAAFDAINIRKGTGNVGGGRDDVAGYNTHSIVLQLREDRVTRNRDMVSGPDAANAVIGVWASTERRALSVRGGQLGPWVQVSRLGNPLVNEVVIPLGQKDRFNETEPKDDLANFGRYVLRPELARVLNALFPGLDVPTENRTDIVTALLTGIPGLTQIAPDAPPTDTLKLNLGVEPADEPNRYGVIKGDTAGFPNGRRLADDVTDVALRVVGGVLVGNPLPLGDGVDRNDKEFLTEFPYVASPWEGFTGSSKRVEPDHDPIP